MLNQIVITEKCAYCGDLTDLPFQCNYCKDPFCSEHRLPEEHRCVKLSLIRAKNLVREKSYEMEDQTSQIFLNEFLKDFKINKDSFQEKFLLVYLDRLEQ